MSTQIDLKTRWVVLTLTVLFAGCLFSQTQEKTDYDYGTRLFQEKLYDLAGIQFDQFIQKYPDSPHAAKIRFYLAQSYFFQGKYPDAQREYLALIIQNPQSNDCAEAQFRIGDCFERSDNLESAISSYNRVYLYYPKSIWAVRGLFKCGKLAFQTGDYPQAESATRTLIEETGDPDIRSRAILLLSDIYLAQHRIEPSIASLTAIKGNPLAAIQLGKIYFQTGQFEKSEQSLQGVLKSTRNDTLLQGANFDLAKLFAFEGKADESLKHFQQSTQSGPSRPMRASSYFQIGKIHEGAQRFDQALAAYTSALQSSSADSIQDRARLGEARCLLQLNRFSEAMLRLQGLIDTPEIFPSLRKPAFLSLAAGFEKSGQSENAVQAYSTYLKFFPDDALCPWVSLKIARLNIRQLGFVTEGLFQLQQIWNQYPASRVVPEARFLYAVGLEKSRRFQEAEQIHRSVINNYPGSVWADRSENRLNRVYRSDRKDVVSSLRAKENADVALGDYFSRVQFDFQRAIQHYRRTNSEKDSILYRIVSAYQSLDELDPLPALTDSLRKYAQNMIANAESSPFDVRVKILLAELEAGQDSKSLYSRYRLIPNQYPEIPDSDRFYLSLGKAAFALDSLDRAWNAFQSTRHEDAAFWKGKIQYRKGDFVQADTLFAGYLENTTKRSHTPEALFYRANIRTSDSRDSLAVSMLETLTDRYGNSACSDSAGLLLGRLYLKHNRYELAISRFRALIEADSLSQLAAVFGLSGETPSLRADATLGLARAYEGSGNFAAAKSSYFKVLMLHPGLRIRKSVSQALSRIAEQEGHLDRAIEYEQDSKSESDSSFYRIGHLQMKAGDYAGAAKSFLAAVNLKSSESLSFEIYKSLAIAFIRQQQITQSESARLVIEKNFKNLSGYEDALAEIEIEKGAAYVQNKDFDLALESFDRVKKKFKKTLWTARADLETGRVLLITNKTENALKLLTEMPAKYPDDPVLDRVYLNLGDHYFRSQQFENALDALKKVVESKRDPEITPLGMRYLIRVYESLGMFDAAIWMTRQYIDAYPNAEDLLQKKVQMGLYAMQLKEYPDAIEKLQAVKFEADAETEAEIQYWIGKCYNEMGQFRQAIFEFLKVKYISKPTKLPWASTALFEAAKAYERLREPDKARQLYEKVVISEGRTSDLGRIAQQKIDEIAQALP